MSTPEEQIAHNTEGLQCRWQETADVVSHAKGHRRRQWGSGILRQPRVRVSHRSCALSFLADWLPKNMAVCAIMMVIMLFKGRNAVRWPEIKMGSRCLQRRQDGWPGGSRASAAAPRPPWGGQTVADASTGHKPLAHRNPFCSGLSSSPWQLPPLWLLLSGGT